MKYICNKKRVTRVCDVQNHSKRDQVRPLIYPEEKESRKMKNNINNLYRNESFCVIENL